MTESEFLARVYAGLSVGMKVVKPRKISEITGIVNGSIYYRIGENNKKSVTTDDLMQLYQKLSDTDMSTADFAAIAGSSRPCNVTTMKWIVTELNHAMVYNGRWKRTW